MYMLLLALQSWRNHMKIVVVNHGGDLQTGPGNALSYFAEVQKTMTESISGRQVVSFVDRPLHDPSLLASLKPQDTGQEVLVELANVEKNPSAQQDQPGVLRSVSLWGCPYFFLTLCPFFLPRHFRALIFEEGQSNMYSQAPASHSFCFHVMACAAVISQYAMGMLEAFPSHFPCVFEGVSLARLGWGPCLCNRRGRTIWELDLAERG